MGAFVSSDSSRYPFFTLLDKSLPRPLLQPLLLLRKSPSLFESARLKENNNSNKKKKFTNKGPGGSEPNSGSEKLTNEKAGMPAAAAAEETTSLVRLGTGEGIRRPQP